MSTYDHKGNRIPEWYELPPITEAPAISTVAINFLLRELDCVCGAPTPPKKDSKETKVDTGNNEKANG